MVRWEWELYTIENVTEGVGNRPHVLVRVARVVLAVFLGAIGRARQHPRGCTVPTFKRSSIYDLISRTMILFYVRRPFFSFENYFISYCLLFMTSARTRKRNTALTAHCKRARSVRLFRDKAWRCGSDPSKGVGQPTATEHQHAQHTQTLTSEPSMHISSVVLSLVSTCVAADFKVVPMSLLVRWLLI